MGYQDRDYYREHHAAQSMPRKRNFPQVNRWRFWQQFGLFCLICCAVVGALFLVVVVRAYWLR